MIDREEIKTRYEATWQSYLRCEAIVRKLDEREEALASQLSEALESGQDQLALTREWGRTTCILEMARERLESIRAEHLEIGRLLDETNPSK